MAGDVPMGAGLSSSAALEFATARAFATASGWPWQPAVMAKISQQLENPSNEMRREAVDLGALTRVVSETYASRAEQAGLNFQLEAPAAPSKTCSTTQ